MAQRPLIIFDFDGVLVDTVDFFEQALKTELAAMGKNFLHSRQDLLDLFDDSIAVALIERGLTPTQMCQVWEHIMHQAESAQIKLCSGVSRMLGELEGMGEMAIVSANSVNTIRAQTERLGVQQYFKYFSGGDDDVRKAGRIAECVQNLHGDAERSFYVCDTAGDVREAHEAGVNAVVVTWGWHPLKHLEEAKPDCIMHEPSELVDFIKTLSST